MRTHSIYFLLTLVVILSSCGIDSNPQVVEGEPLDYTIVSSDRSADTASFKVLIPAPPLNNEELPTSQTIYNEAGPGTMSMYKTIRIDYYMPTMDFDSEPAFTAIYNDKEWTFEVPEQRIDFKVDSRDKLIEEYEKISNQIEAEKALQENIKSQFSSWDGSHTKLVRAIKDNMNDPKSFEHVETRYGVNEEDGILNLIMKFRGNNAFGQKVLNSVIAIADLETGEIIQAEMQE